ncbi:RES family NAD+ phosphorylase [Herbiconiux sp. CPCC 205716]|uniref:RES family NAD+ phosphorylase n=1 Tax=Herbiconiux gentiana TaxID=2970912 RepID=A0ABT2GLD7_9MICO|nr:RES family NAD+ phosphorylase [Herbiconiux gentiana]MCS5715576.1 RES family NAD+ phosphorylase [Herbiconiux gentiana]
MSRQPPPALGLDLADFPRQTLPEGRVVHRSHRPDLGPCYFNGTPHCRFNLGGGRGTCYVADDIATAVREKVRESVFDQGVVPASLANSFVVSSIRVARSFSCADIASADSVTHGVTRMLGTMDDYVVPQQWATAFDKAGFDGVRYGSSYTNGPSTAWALFDEEGEHPFGDVTAVLPGAAACALAGITVYGPPHSDELEIV